MLLLLMLSVIVSAVMYVTSKFVKRFARKLRNASLQLIKGHLLALTLFCTISIGFSLGLQVNYGSASVLNILIEVCTIACLIGVLQGLMYAHPKEYFEFATSLRPGIVSKSYFVVTILYRLVLGFLIGLLNDSDIGPMFPFFVSVAFFMYQISNVPFRKGYNNYRAISYQVGIMVLLWISMYYRSMKKNVPVVEVSQILFTGVLQILVVFACTLIGCACLVY